MESIIESLSTSRFTYFLEKLYNTVMSVLVKKRKIGNKENNPYNHLALDTWSVNGSGSSLPIPGMYP